MTIAGLPKDLRWDPYALLNSDDLLSTLSESPARVVVVLGVGFDPRCCRLLQLLEQADLLSRSSVVLLNYALPTDSAAGTVAQCLLGNRQETERLSASSGGVVTVNLAEDEADRRRIARRAIAFATQVSLAEYTHVLVDVSALPRTVFFPLVGALMERLDTSEAGPNLLVIASESVDIDRSIVDTPGQRATYVVGFAGRLDQQADRERPLLWMPILGEDQSLQLRRVYELLAPDEIAPVLPSPAASPRRADELIGEYHQLLFDEWGVEPGNVVYASERNPFEVYRQLYETVQRYHRALEPLGGCRVAISAHSSKLMSLGVLLAAYQCRQHQMRVGVAHVESDETVFTVDTQDSARALASRSTIHALWIADARQ